MCKGSASRSNYFREQTVQRDDSTFDRAIDSHCEHIFSYIAPNPAKFFLRPTGKDFKLCGAERYSGGFLVLISEN
jgi:hypothetical protein